MNTEKTIPLPVPMVKETTVKDDGRYLFYYTFPPETPPSAAGNDVKQREDADV